ncbi:MAG: hypothetical protein ACOYXA_11415 [Bacteroidota bacterium]
MKRLITFSIFVTILLLVAVAQKSRTTRPAPAAVTAVSPVSR